MQGGCGHGEKGWQEFYIEDILLFCKPPFFLVCFPRSLEAISNQSANFGLTLTRYLLTIGAGMIFACYISSQENINSHRHKKLSVLKSLLSQDKDLWYLSESWICHVNQHVPSVSMLMSAEKELYRTNVVRLAPTSKTSQKWRWELLFFIL